MKLHFSKKGNFILSLLLLLFIFGILYIQFFYVNPLKYDLKLKNQALDTEQNLLNSISHKKNNAETINTNTSELQRRLPVDPLQDQFILDLEQAETVSNSQIKSMNFTSGEQTDTQADQNNNGNRNNIQQFSSATNGNTLQQSANSKENPSQGNELPNGVKKLTVQLSVESQGYGEFEKFIDALEGLKRIVVVEAIDYSAGSEVTSLDQGSKPFSFNLTVSTFYMPVLTDLKGQLPKIEAPNPAEKQNPLNQFPEINSP